MNSSHFPILYLSESRPYLCDELETRGWQVLRTDSVMAALGTYIFYQPRVVLLAGNSPMTREVLYHLLNITAPSVWQVDHIFWLGEMTEQWDVPDFIRLRVLPASLPIYALEMELNEAAGLVPA
jgi:hypothetical protein